eukprot:TRINITY_DN547_c0_g2_i1.p2 TRINITY_DN547_c0_g2~~TRINITY_DN547_c0_g2_i1.p2  ORF type:complete len:153 (+),score=51.56 TRINITY_DN547_c0_g2_i1:147-605(+)
MVVKTEICEFSDHRIYPGKGFKYVSKDGKTHQFLNRKSGSHFLKKVRAQNIRWTISWRRLNKKIKTDEASKKRKKRVIRTQRAIVGITLEDIQRKRSEKPQERQAQREQALREIKDRKAKVAATKKKTTTTVKTTKVETTTVPKKAAKGKKK